MMRPLRLRPGAPVPADLDRAVREAVREFLAAGEFRACPCGHKIVALAQAKLDVDALTGSTGLAEFTLGCPRCMEILEPTPDHDRFSGAKDLALEGAG